jgi:hypothetical protein
MNKAQQYINDYLNCGWKHYRTALTPMDRTGDFAKDRQFRKELFEHCENHPNWKKGVVGGRVAFSNSKVGGDFGIVIDFNKGLAGGISHEY